MNRILVSRAEAAKLLGISIVTLDKRLDEMEKVSKRYCLPVYRTPGMVRINMLCLLDFLGNYERIQMGIPLLPFNPEKLSIELNLLMKK